MPDQAAISIPVIDVRTIPPVNRHAKIFEVATALAEGASFIIVNDHDPRPLHYHIESRYPDLFSWEYLNRGRISGALKSAGFRLLAAAVVAATDSQASVR